MDVFQTRNTQLQRRVDEVVDAGSTWTGATLELTEESIQGYAALRTLAEIDAGAVFEQLGAAQSYRRILVTSEVRRQRLELAI